MDLQELEHCLEEKAEVVYGILMVVSGMAFDKSLPFGLQSNKIIF